MNPPPLPPASPSFPIFLSDGVNNIKPGGGGGNMLRRNQVRRELNQERIAEARGKSNLAEDKLGNYLSVHIGIDMEKKKSVI